MLLDIVFNPSVVLDTLKSIENVLKMWRVTLSTGLLRNPYFQNQTPENTPLTKLAPTSLFSISQSSENREVGASLVNGQPPHKGWLCVFWCLSSYVRRTYEDPRESLWDSRGQNQKHHVIWVEHSGESNNTTPLRGQVVANIYALPILRGASGFGSPHISNIVWRTPSTQSVEGKKNAPTK